MFPYPRLSNFKQSFTKPTTETTRVLPKPQTLYKNRERKGKENEPNGA